MMVARDVLEAAAPAAPLTGLPGPVWCPAERVMENVVGSAYEFAFHEDPETGHTIFRRLAKPLTGGRRSYTSPDRR